jgi:dolichyl-phosphate beta-glucosyltransferase
VERHAAADPRVRLVRCAHRGKGAAVRAGMIASRGAWRFLSDADLSMPPDNLRRFFEDPAAATSIREVRIGSREAAGARRIDEPRSRHLMGRLFNLFVRVIAVPGVRDTQCGFKLFSGAAATSLFAHARVDGFAFDVEILFLARRLGLAVREIAIDWRARHDGRMTFARGATAFSDVIRVRWYAWRGRYDRIADPAVALASGTIE